MVAGATNRGRQGREHGLVTRSTSTVEVATTKYTYSIRDKIGSGERFQSTPPCAATAIVPVATTCTGENPSSEISAEQFQTDLTTVRTARDTLTSKLQYYKVRVLNNFFDWKHSNNTVSALGKHVEKLEMEKEALHSE